MADNIEEQLNSARFQRNPYPTYQRLREQAPVYWSDEWDGWLVTRYEDVKSVLRDPSRFSNSGRQSGLLNQLSAEEKEELQSLRDHYERGGLINSDPPTHTRLRRILNESFTPQTVNKLEPVIQNIIDRLLEDCAEKGEWDVVGDFAYPLPSTVIATMLGVPAEDRDRFKEWSRDINNFTQSGTTTREKAIRAQDSMMALKEYVGKLLTDRSENPQDDLISTLANISVESEGLTDKEIQSTCCTLLTAGHETTTNLIGNSILALNNHPTEMEELRRDPDLVPDAIEEFLRFTGPVQTVKRIATESVEIKGQTIREGDLVYAVIASANRDPAVFSNPDALDFHRDHEDHLAFGSGIHFCLGAPLARLEGQLAIRSFLDTFSEFDIETDRLEWVHASGLRGLDSAPITTAV